MTEIVVVNASRVLTDAEVNAAVKAMQVWDDTMLRPAWGFDACTYSFMPWGELPRDDDPRWPIYINRHSAELGVGGFHDDQAGRIYGRIFAGDALRYGVSWTVDLSHEAAEMRGDPTINLFVTLPNGQTSIRELCDPCESDRCGIAVNGHLFSDFVLPPYFAGGNGPYDYQNQLVAPAPALLPGGYISIYDGAAWHQVTAMLMGGPPSWRSVRWHHTHRRLGMATPP